MAAPNFYVLKVYLTEAKAIIGDTSHALQVNSAGKVTQAQQSAGYGFWTHTKYWYRIEANEPVLEFYIDWDDGEDNNPEGKANYTSIKLDTPSFVGITSHIYTGNSRIDGGYFPKIRCKSVDGFWSKFYQNSAGLFSHTGIDVLEGETALPIGRNSKYRIESDVSAERIPALYPVVKPPIAVLKADKKRIYAGIDNAYLRGDDGVFGGETVTLIEAPNSGSAIRTGVDIEVTYMTIGANDSTDGNRGDILQTTLNTGDTLPNVSKILKVELLNLLEDTVPFNGSSPSTTKLYPGEKMVLVAGAYSDENQQTLAEVSLGNPIVILEDNRYTITYDLTESFARTSEQSISNYYIDDGKFKRGSGFATDNYFQGFVNTAAAHSDIFTDTNSILEVTSGIARRNYVFDIGYNYVDSDFRWLPKQILARGQIKVTNPMSSDPKRTQEYSFLEHWINDSHTTNYSDTVENVAAYNWPSDVASSSVIAFKGAQDPDLWTDLEARNRQVGEETNFIMKSGGASGNDEGGIYDIDHDDATSLGDADNRAMLFCGRDSKWTKQFFKKCVDNTYQEQGKADMVIPGSTLDGAGVGTTGVGHMKTRVQILYTGYENDKGSTCMWKPLKILNNTKHPDYNDSTWYTDGAFEWEEPEDWALIGPEEINNRFWPRGDYFSSADSTSWAYSSSIQRIDDVVEVGTVQITGSNISSNNEVVSQTNYDRTSVTAVDDGLSLVVDPSTNAASEIISRYFTFSEQATTEGGTDEDFYVWFKQAPTNQKERIWFNRDHGSNATQYSDYIEQPGGAGTQPYGKHFTLTNVAGQTHGFWMDPSAGGNVGVVAEVATGTIEILEGCYVTGTNGGLFEVAYWEGDKIVITHPTAGENGVAVAVAYKFNADGASPAQAGWYTLYDDNTIDHDDHEAGISGTDPQTFEFDVGISPSASAAGGSGVITATQIATTLKAAIETYASPSHAIGETPGYNPFRPVDGQPCKFTVTQVGATLTLVPIPAPVLGTPGAGGTHGNGNITWNGNVNQIDVTPFAGGVDQVDINGWWQGMLPEWDYAPWDITDPAVEHSVNIRPTFLLGPGGYASKTIAMANVIETTIDSVSGIFDCTYNAQSPAYLDIDFLQAGAIAEPLYSNVSNTVTRSNTTNYAKTDFNSAEVATVTITGNPQGGEAATVLTHTLLGTTTGGHAWPHSSQPADAHIINIDGVSIAIPGGETGAEVATLIASQSFPNYTAVTSRRGDNVGSSNNCVKFTQKVGGTAGNGTITASDLIYLSHYSGVYHTIVGSDGSTSTGAAPVFGYQMQDDPHAARQNTAGANGDTISFDDLRDITIVAQDNATTSSTDIYNPTFVVGTSNNDSATNLASCLNATANLTAVASSNVVTITRTEGWFTHVLASGHDAKAEGQDPSTEYVDLSSKTAIEVPYTDGASDQALTDLIVTYINAKSGCNVTADELNSTTVRLTQDYGGAVANVADGTGATGTKSLGTGFTFATPTAGAITVMGADYFASNSGGHEEDDPAYSSKWDATNKKYGLLFMIETDSGTAGTPDSYKHMNIQHTWPCSNSHSVLIDLIDPMCVSLNNFSIVQSISFVHKGKYQVVKDRLGKSDIRKIGSEGGSMKFGGIDLASETIRAKFYEFQSQATPVYLDVEHRNGDFSRFFGVLTDMSEDHPTGGVSPKFAVTMEVSHMITLDSNGTILSDGYISLGGNINEPSYI